MKAFLGVLTALSIPLLILNMLGGIVSGIWLAILGEWGAVGLGILFFFISTWLLGLAIMPSLLLAAPAVYCAEKGKTLGLVCFGALSSLYILAVVTVWCCGMLFLFVKDASASSLIPRLIWSFGVATGPWVYMASKDQGPQGEGFASSCATFLAQLAYLVIMLLVIFTPITLFGAIQVFGGFMLVALVLQMSFAVIVFREQKRVEQQSDALAGYGWGQTNGQQAPTFGEIRNEEDWRLTGQEDYLNGATFIHRKYRQNKDNPDWDHDHCEFCMAKFCLRGGEGSLQEGYATEDDYYWVCCKCFDDFKDKLGWQVIEGMDDTEPRSAGEGQART